MDPVLPPLHKRISQRITSVQDWFGKLFSLLGPQIPEDRSQRMCPFCGRITPSAKWSCLECGKPLRALRTEREDAH